MQRIALGFLASGAILFSSGWLQLTGLWSIVAGVVSLTFGAILLAIAMEEADLSMTRGTLDGPTRLTVPDSAA